MIIRGAQIEALGQQAAERFGENMRATLARDYPRHYAALGDDGAGQFVRRCIAAAAGLGVTTTGAVAVLIELMLQYGERFERSPDREWINNILANTDVPDFLRVGAVRDRLATWTGGRTFVAVMGDAS